MRKYIFLITAIAAILAIAFSVPTYASAEKTPLAEITELTEITDYRPNSTPLVEIVSEKASIIDGDGRRRLIDVIPSVNPNESNSDEDIDYKKFGIIEDYDSLPWARRAICDFALSCVGEIPYYFGGKPSEKTLDGHNDFGSYMTKSDHKGRTLKGLDCSSFVNFCYWSVLDKFLGSWTGNITDDALLIPSSELKPGDISMHNVPGVSSNHTGLFVGHNKEGRELWVHCSSEAETVVCEPYSGWNFYYTVL